MREGDRERERMAWKEDRSTVNTAMTMYEESDTGTTKRRLINRDVVANIQSLPHDQKSSQSQQCQENYSNPDPKISTFVPRALDHEKFLWGNVDVMTLRRSGAGNNGNKGRDIFSFWVISDINNNCKR